VPLIDWEDDKSGLRIEGLYQRMLEREREKCSQPDPRKTFADPNNPDAGFYCRPRSLLDALEAEKSVLAQRSSVRLAYWYLTGLKQDPFPWDRSVKTVQVTPADVVTASDREIPWYGCSVDEFVAVVR
jgi:hypothetical protein